MATTATPPNASSVVQANACAATDQRFRFRSFSRLLLVMLACAGMAACGDPVDATATSGGSAVVAFDSDAARELGETSVQQAGFSPASPSKPTPVDGMDGVDGIINDSPPAVGSSPASVATPVVPDPASVATPVVRGPGSAPAPATNRGSGNDATKPTPDAVPPSSPASSSTDASTPAPRPRQDSSDSGQQPKPASPPDQGSTPAPRDEPGSSPASPAPVAKSDYTSRPFASDSPWNQPIAANAKYRNSDARTSAIRGAPTFGTNTSKWTIWVWQARESDPMVSVSVSVRHLTSSGNANAGTVKIRIPANAHADPELDSHMTILDPDGKHAHEFWYAKKSGNSFTAVSYAKVPLDSSGVNVSGYAAHNSDYLTYGWGATRAYGGSQIGGLIRKGEVTQGPIEHAIAVAIPARYLGGRAVWPATSDDQSPDYAGSIPMGTRFAIPPDVNVENLGLSPAYLRLARALQKYGLIVVDKSGSPCMFAEGLTAQADGNALNANRSHMTILQTLLVAVD